MSSKFLLLKQKYLSSFEKKAQDIESAWHNKDFDLLKELVHKLAGSSGSYEFNNVSILCRQTLDLLENRTSQTVELIGNNIKSLISLLRQYQN